VLLHHCSGSNLFRPLSVSARLLSFLFDMLVLTLFFAAGTPQMFFLRHDLTSCRFSVTGG
jgi:hypothetical protein